jgi:hypothetical protein
MPNFTVTPVHAKPIEIAEKKPAHIQLPSLFPRPDVPVATQKMERRAAEIVAQQVWVNSVKPPAWTPAEQRHCLNALIIEAHHYHQERESLALERKAEAIRRQAGTQGKVSLPPLGSQKGGISPNTAKMLKDDIDVIFQHYEDPYSAGKKALQTFGLWQV